MVTTEDRLQIHQTLALHAHLVDADELDRLEDLFTPEAVYDMSSVGLGVFHGIGEIRVAAARLSQSGHAPLAHYLTNVLLIEGQGEGDGDAVVARSKGLMIMADGAVQGVTHVDTVYRLDGGWRIGRRVITPAQRPVGAGAGRDQPQPAENRAPQQSGISG